MTSDAAGSEEVILDLDATSKLAFDLLAEHGPLTLRDGRLFVGDDCIEGDHVLVDTVAAQACCGCSVFRGNIRVATTASAAGSTERALWTTTNQRVTRQVLYNGLAFQGIARTLGKDWYIRYSPLRAVDGLLVGMMAVYRELDRYAGRLDQVSGVVEAVIAHDSEGRIVDLNPTACDLWGRPRHMLVGASMYELVDNVEGPSPWQDPGEERVLTEADWLRGDASLRMRHAVRRAPASWAAPLVTVARDWTDAAEARRALQAANDRLIAASRAKSNFLANMSHELRTPLNAILGYTELLSDAIEDGDTEPDVLVLDLDRIHRSAVHLLSLIGEVLDLAKIEAGRLELVVEPVALDDFLRQCRGGWVPLASRRANTLLVETHAALGTIRSDPTRLRQCLDNLVSNAAKFTTEGTITVSAERHGAAVRFTVADTGLGMTADQLARVFDAFEQAEVTTSRDFGGTGLGLALVRQLAGLLGGYITVHSEPGVGTTFELQIAADLKSIVDPD